MKNLKDLFLKKQETGLIREFDDDYYAHWHDTLLYHLMPQRRVYAQWKDLRHPA